MKIVTYNVNGLRPRVSQHGSLLKLLNSLDADIICFQETKLSRQDLSADLTMAEGYEAFFSCTRTSDKGRIRYSGVATFCRVKSAFSSNEVALPVAAEEGITGLLENSGKRKLLKKSLFLEDLNDVTIDDLLKVDSEGRCVVTDHGHFVLFNLYGPCAEEDDSERIQFKSLFFKILQKRWEYLISNRRRVFVVGDLNIAPTAMDRCDAKPDFEENRFRTWLRSMLIQDGGPFIDCFRAKHPMREGAYTCWSQSVGAEEFNFGSRIDHILVDAHCFHHNDEVTEEHSFLKCHLEESDIMTQFKRENQDIRYRWNGGRSIKLEGSDHVPVYICLRNVPDLPVHNTPSFSVRYMPEVRGCQQTIVSVLMKRKAVGVKHPDILMSSSTLDAIDSTYVGQDTISSCSIPSEGGEQSEVCATSNLEAQRHSQNRSEHLPEVSVVAVNQKEMKSNTRIFQVKKAKSSSIQKSIKSFFQQSQIPDSGISANNSVATQAEVEMNYHFSRESVCSSSAGCHIEMGDESGTKGTTSFDASENLDHDAYSRHSSSDCKENSALLQWQKIQQKMQNSIPLCKGHGEPCVARSVKKPGPNIGRGFYVCARPKGPASNPDASCDYFKWASGRSSR